MELAVERRPRECEGAQLGQSARLVEEELIARPPVTGCDESEVIAYCRIGERSSHTWFVLSEILGYPNVRNYDGSWTEYGSLVGVPIEVGEGR